MCENISEAARFLNISPSVLSRHVAQVESQVGYTLFERKQGSPTVKPTAHGEVFIAAAQDIQLRLTKLNYDLSRVGPDSFAVRIGSSLGKVLQRQIAFSAAKEALPEYRVALTNLSAEASLNLLKGGEVDLACEPVSDYALRTFNMHNVEVRHLFYEPVYLMIHPEDALSDLESAPVAKLQGFYFLHTYAQNEALMEAHLHEVCDRAGFEALIEIQPFEDTFTLINEKLAPGHGLVVPQSETAALQADFPDARFVPLEEKWSDLDVCVFVPKEASVAARSFADELVIQF